MQGIHDKLQLQLNALGGAVEHVDSIWSQNVVICLTKFGFTLIYIIILLNDLKKCNDRIN